MCEVINLGFLEDIGIVCVDFVDWFDLEWLCDLGCDIVVMGYYCCDCFLCGGEVGELCIFCDVLDLRELVWGWYCFWVG